MFVVTMKVDSGKKMVDMFEEQWSSVYLSSGLPVSFVSPETCRVDAISFGLDY